MINRISSLNCALRDVRLSAQRSNLLSINSKLQSRCYASREQIERFMNRNSGQRYSRGPGKDIRVHQGPIYDSDVNGSLNTHITSNPSGIIQPSDPAAALLEQPALVIERQIEYMNVFLGFEQANRYAILDVSGNHLGYMEEEDFGFGKAILRQIYRLHRPFKVRVLDRHGYHVLSFQRPFSWINSRVKVMTPPTENANSTIIGETHQSWHLWRRKYNLFLQNGPGNFDQFAAIDAPMLSFRFDLLDEYNRLLGKVDRNWVGLGRELFTDTGVYILQMDAASLEDSSASERVLGMTLDQRAVMLATAVSIDFDYFSRHSSPGRFRLNLVITMRYQTLPAGIHESLDRINRELWIFTSLTLKNDETFMPSLKGEKYMHSLLVALENLELVASSTKYEMQRCLEQKGYIEASENFKTYLNALLHTVSENIKADKLDELVRENMSAVMPDTITMPPGHSYDLLNSAVDINSTTSSLLNIASSSAIPEYRSDDFGFSELDDDGDFDNYSTSRSFVQELQASFETISRHGSINDDRSIYRGGSISQRRHNVDTQSPRDISNIYINRGNDFSIDVDFTNEHNNTLSRTSRFFDNIFRPTRNASLRESARNRLCTYRRGRSASMNCVDDQAPSLSYNGPRRHQSLQSPPSSNYMSTNQNLRRLSSSNRHTTLDQFSYHYRLRGDPKFTWIGKVYGQEGSMGRVTCITKFTKLFTSNTLNSSQFCLANKIFENLLQLIILEKIFPARHEQPYIIKKGDLTQPNKFTTFLLNMQSIVFKMASILEIEMTSPYQLDPYIMTTDYGLTYGNYSRDGTSKDVIMECSVVLTQNQKILFARKSPYIHFEKCEGYSGELYYLTPRVLEPFFMPENVQWTMMPDLPWLVYDSNKKQFVGLAPNFQQKTLLQTTLIAKYLWKGVFREIQQPIELEISIREDADIGSMSGMLSVHYPTNRTNDEDQSQNNTGSKRRAEYSNNSDTQNRNDRCITNTVVAEIVPSYEETMSVSNQSIRQYLSNTDDSIDTHNPEIAIEREITIDESINLTENENSIEPESRRRRTNFPILSVDTENVYSNGTLAFVHFNTGRTCSSDSSGREW
ncbi:Scramblase-domain-containing protein [Dipodascopsis uninucleata]